MKKNESQFTGAYKITGIYPVIKEDGERICHEPKARRSSKETALLSKCPGNAGHLGQSDKIVKGMLNGNSQIIAGRVERARVAYRPSNKISKLTAAALEKAVAAEMGGAVCEWDVPFDICCGKNLIDLKTIRNTL
jgi:hypothetical protein